MSPRHLLPTALLLAFLLAPALAQAGPGVQVQVDKAGGVTRCAHTSVNSMLDRTGVTLVQSGAGLLIGVAHMVADWDKDSAFGPDRTGEERVRFQFAPGDVLVAEPLHVSGDREATYELAGFQDPGLLDRLLAATEDVRVRFVGPSRSVDFVISRDVLRDLAGGFGQVCI